MDMQTLFSLSFFKKNQVLVQPNMVFYGWLTDIEHSEVKYMYHHLKRGKVLTLLPINEETENPSVNIFYKNFKVGTISSFHAVEIIQLLQTSNSLLATVEDIIKEKYMPVTGIRIKIKKISQNFYNVN